MTGHVEEAGSSAQGETREPAQNSAGSLFGAGGAGSERDGVPGGEQIELTEEWLELKFYQQ